MKVAVAVKDNLVTDHFGHCDYFLVHEVQEGKVIGTEIIKNPPHEKGYLPNFLYQNGVNVIITGNLGETALRMMEERNIRVFRGANGLVSDIMDQYLNGTLESSDIICREHQYHSKQ
jgi:predicted Fe-Mo cluster-binding NifX family protein